MTKLNTVVCISILISLMFYCCEKESDLCPIEYYPHPNQIDTIRHDDVLRTYKLHVPPDYTGSDKVPLVIALHGYGDSASTIERYTQFSEKANAEGFIIAYPYGKEYLWAKKYKFAWNCGGKWDEWTEGTDDVGFIDNMIELIKRCYNINDNMIYVTGHSAGAFMAYKLGYNLSCKIAAIAPLAGPSYELPERAPDCPVSIVYLHAIDDINVLYEGYPSSSGVGHYFSADSTLSHWANWFSCNTKPDTSEIDKDYLLKTWDCSSETTFWFYMLNQGGHSWPRSSNSNFIATDIIWEFFKNHPKN